jgi:hypothetical protein
MPFVEVADVVVPVATATKSPFPYVIPDQFIVPAGIVVVVHVKPSVEYIEDAEPERRATYAVLNVVKDTFDEARFKLFIVETVAPEAIDVDPSVGDEYELSGDPAIKIPPELSAVIKVSVVPCMVKPFLTLKPLSDIVHSP